MPNFCYHRYDLCDDSIIPDANYLRTLDSSIKRNTTVIKKLKTINDEQKDGLMDELKSVNLSKFVSEAVSYICEAKLRSADIQAAVQVICNSKGLLFYVKMCISRRYAYDAISVGSMICARPSLYLKSLGYMLKHVHYSPHLPWQPCIASCGQY